jgi:hypothetical protein
VLSISYLGAGRIAGHFNTHNLDYASALNAKIHDKPTTRRLVEKKSLMFSTLLLLLIILTGNGFLPGGSPTKTHK